MAKIAFVTDSTACLTKEQEAAYGISVVPLSVVFGQEAFREGIDMTQAEFYARLATSPSLPTTSQPSAGAFVEVFERLLADHDVVLCLLLSARLSGTLRSAETAAGMVDGKVIVVDSKIASYGIAGPLMDGVLMARSGCGASEIQTYWETVREGVQARFVIDTLEYLHKGGRIGGAAAVFGAMLQIKPILTLIDGKIELHEKVRTHRKAMDKMLADFDAAARKGNPIRLGVVHSERREDAEALAAALSGKYENVQTEVGELGPVIGTHTGPGVLALVWYETDEATVALHRG